MIPSISLRQDIRLIDLAFESERMAVPKAQFIGLSDKDIGGAKELLKYRWFQKKDWQDEIKRTLASGLKHELDVLANKDFRYLTKTYLPRKAQKGRLAGLARRAIAADAPARYQSKMTAPRLCFSGGGPPERATNGAGQA